MNKQQKLTPKYWVVHDTQTDDVFTDTLRKSKDGSEEVFLDNYGFRLAGFLSDDELYEWYVDQDQYVCSLVEVKLVEINKTGG